MMSSISGRDTKPEVLIAKALFRKGFRYRKHYKSLPGKPDLVFPRYREIISVNGCFWHRHHCHLFKWPATRREFWENKINGTVHRDERNSAFYRAEGWRELVIWECSIKGKYRRDIDEVVNSTAIWLKGEALAMSIAGKDS